jgi:hypothetical protein
MGHPMNKKISEELESEVREAWNDAVCPNKAERKFSDCTFSPMEWIRWVVPNELALSTHAVIWRRSYLTAKGYAECLIQKSKGGANG